MKTLKKLTSVLPFLVVFFASTVNAQTEMKRLEKQADTSLQANTMQKAPGSEKANRAKLEAVEPSQEGETTDGATKTKPAFQGTGPAMARDNPDA